MSGAAGAATDVHDQDDRHRERLALEQGLDGEVRNRLPVLGDGEVRGVERRSADRAAGDRDGDVRVAAVVEADLARPHRKRRRLRERGRAGERQHRQNRDRDDPPSTHCLPHRASRANGSGSKISTSSSDLSVYNSSGNVHVILDVTGYFQ